jgi:hypothetical protein
MKKTFVFLRGVSVPEQVHCDVCGKIFSSRHVSSHKRLAHAKANTPIRADQPDQIEAIVQLFKSLPIEKKTRVLATLAGLQHKSL